MSATTTVGPYTISVRTAPGFRFVTLHYGEVYDAKRLVMQTDGFANYEQAKATATAAARSLLTADEFHDAGFCSVDDHCGCIRETPASDDVRCERCGEPMTADEVATDSRHCSQCLAAIEDEDGDEASPEVAEYVNDIASRPAVVREPIDAARVEEMERTIGFQFAPADSTHPASDDVRCADDDYSSPNR